MKILVIGGFLGSGKTTTVLRLGKELSEEGMKVAIIVNEIGEIGIDGDIISKYGLRTTELTNGCICCSLKVNMKTTITLLLKEYQPDVLIIEPTGIAFPQMIKKELELMDLKDTTVQPLVTLIDGSRFKQLMKEVKNFAMRQIIDADVLGINKIDIMDKHMLPIIETAVQQLNPNAKVILLSASKEDEHWDEMVGLLMGEKLQRNNDSVLKANGAAILMDRATGRPVDVAVNSIDASGIASYATECVIADMPTERAMDLVRKLMEKIQADVTSASPMFVGHIKLFAESDTDTVRANLTAHDMDIGYEIIRTDNAQPRRLKVLVAVSGIGHGQLVQIVSDAVKVYVKK